MLVQCNFVEPQSFNIFAVPANKFRIIFYTIINPAQLSDDINVSATDHHIYHIILEIATYVAHKQVHFNQLYALSLVERYM